MIPAFERPSCQALIAEESTEETRGRAYRLAYNGNDRWDHWTVAGERGGAEA